MDMPYLPVAERTVDAGARIPALEMTRDTALHSELGVVADERPREGKHALGNLTVARLAQHLSRKDVSAMGEAHVLGELVHALPGDRLFVDQHLGQLDLLGAVADRFFVTVDAVLPDRNRGVIRLFRAAMTVGAGNLLFGDVDLVFEGDGLLDVRVDRAAEREGRAARSTAEASASDPSA
jgi:hypothetical protein